MTIHNEILMNIGSRLPRLSRGYASRSSRLDAALSLDHFIQRARVLSFYRSILRSTGHIHDAKTRSESRKYVRDEFDRHRSVTDLSHIRYLMSTGKTEWETMERYIHGMSDS